MALNIDNTCGFKKEGGYMAKAWIFFGKEEWVPETFTFQASYRSRPYSWQQEISKKEFDKMTSQQRHTPLYMMTLGQRHWWWFGDTFYYTTETSRDPLVIKGLLLQKESRTQNKEERARAAARGEPPPKRAKARSKNGAQTHSAPAARQCPYSTLGVPKTASFTEIKAAYRKRMTEYHPDKVASLGTELRNLAEEMTKRINNAYEELGSIHRA